MTERRELEREIAAYRNFILGLVGQEALERFEATVLGKRKLRLAELEERRA